MSWPKYFEVYERTPIAISSHCVILVRIYSGTDHLADSWTWDSQSQQEHDSMRYQLAAEQFHKQLEGRDCVAFWQAMREEADKVIKEWEARCKEAA